MLERPLELSTQCYAECKISPGSVKRSDIHRAREMAQRGKHVLCEQEDFMLIFSTHMKAEGGSCKPSACEVDFRGSLAIQLSCNGGLQS